VFFFRDPLRFPDLNHAIKRDPRTGLRSTDNNWDFRTMLPEALHQGAVVMSDRGIPKSVRHMHGFGSHTFPMINAADQRVWVKFHFRSQQGIGTATVLYQVIGFSLRAASQSAFVSVREGRSGMTDGDRAWFGEYEAGSQNNVPPAVPE
jgi:catalase